MPRRDGSPSAARAEVWGATGMRRRAVSRSEIQGAGSAGLHLLDHLVVLHRPIEPDECGGGFRLDHGSGDVVAGERSNGLDGGPSRQHQKFHLALPILLQEAGSQEARDRLQLREHIPSEVIAGKPPGFEAAAHPRHVLTIMPMPPRIRPALTVKHYQAAGWAARWGRARFGGGSGVVGEAVDEAAEGVADEEADHTQGLVYRAVLDRQPGGEHTGVGLGQIVDFDRQVRHRRARAALRRDACSLSIGGVRDIWALHPRNGALALFAPASKSTESARARLICRQPTPV